ncbi:MAG: hypothetical protein WC850_02235 [Candidatus Gracilibacteria bacterium]
MGIENQGNYDVSYLKEQVNKFFKLALNEFKKSVPKPQKTELPKPQISASESFEKYKQLENSSTDIFNENKDLYDKISYKHPGDGEHYTFYEKIKYDVVGAWHGTVIPLSPKEWNDISKLKEAISTLEGLKATYMNDLLVTSGGASGNLASGRLGHINDELAAYTARIQELEGVA